ncbi:MULTISPECIES: hypothetical protein [Pseudomonas]|uniref:hypothetical protein n=1 Tax=Pseudomonas TaxID=286 RepID=UPI001472A522|nr:MULTISPECIES: hypothetical protein [Pseudomonas]MEC4242241.1 hypothetical protein [Pseudomonas sp. DSV-1]NNB33894.1 hypothetical protein [Pseudomonas fragi]
MKFGIGLVAGVIVIFLIAYGFDVVTEPEPLAPMQNNQSGGIPVTDHGNNCKTTGPNSPIVTGEHSVVVVNGKTYAPGQNANCVPGTYKISTHGAGSPIVTGAGARVTSTVER